MALAAALRADELIIYTDVDGIFSSDPRVCPDAVRRERISYDDMLLLAQKGAQVLHDRSVALAQQSGVPVTVKSCEPSTSLGPPLTNETVAVSVTVRSLETRVTLPV